MKLSELEAANAETLAAIRSGQSSREKYPYYGYIEVDIFECPPFVMFSNGDSPTVFCILYDRSFEPQSLKTWCRLAPTATGILDIGANVGVYSLVAATLRRDIPIHAFEPNPHAYARLRVNKSVNRFENIIEHPYALSTKNEYTELSWVKKPNSPISSGAVIKSRADDTIESAPVPVKKLNGTGLAATLGPRPLIKIDVEGHEALVMTGMTEILQLGPDIIVETFDQECCDLINGALLPLGYRVYLIREQEGDLEPREKLVRATRKGTNYNQLMTLRPASEIDALMAAPAFVK